MKKKFEVFMDNKPIYKQHHIDKIMNDFNYRKSVVGFVYGEFGEIDSYDISLQKISHTIEKLYVEKGDLMADIKILNTHTGKVLKGLI